MMQMLDHRHRRHKCRIHAEENPKAHECGKLLSLKQKAAEKEIQGALTCAFNQY